jgi:hypothetical protein
MPFKQQTLAIAKTSKKKLSKDAGLLFVVMYHLIVYITWPDKTQQDILPPGFSIALFPTLISHPTLRLISQSPCTKNEFVGTATGKLSNSESQIVPILKSPSFKSILENEEIWTVFAESVYENSLAHASLVQLLQAAQEVLVAVVEG